MQIQNISMQHSKINFKGKMLVTGYDSSSYSELLGIYNKLNRFSQRSGSCKNFDCINTQDIPCIDLFTSGEDTRKLQMCTEEYERNHKPKGIDEDEFYRDNLERHIGPLPQKVFQATDIMEAIESGRFNFNTLRPSHKKKPHKS